jgi:hypothetical protein
MAGDNEISNELTLDVTQFTQNLEKATQKLDSLGKKIENVDSRSGRLEKDFQNLGSNVEKASRRLGAVTDNLNGLSGGLDRAKKSLKASGDGSKRLSKDLESLTKSARESQIAMSSVEEWTAFYGTSLEQLRPKMDAIIQTQKGMAEVTANMTKAEVNAIQKKVDARVKDLKAEKQVNEERIKSRREMIEQLEVLERRAETSATVSRASAYKTNAKGNEVRRYIGKNTDRHNEIMAEVEAYREEAKLARQQKEHITAIVGELKYRNDEISRAVSAEQSILSTNKQILETERERLAEAKILASAKSEALKAQMVQEKELAAKKKVEHQEQMKRLKEEEHQHRTMMALVTGAVAVGTTGKAVDQIAQYQDTLNRLKAYNFSAEDNERIMARSEKLTQNNKFLSKTQALQGNIDAISALAHNDPEYIDKTIDSVMKDAFILKTQGYDQGELSDIVKNIYTAIEARGLTRPEDAKDAEKTSDLMRRMVITSGGKVTVADMEAVLRNAGDSVMTMSDEGWLKLLPLIEQNKTSGGGNGGGGGVTRVGTMIKMLSLMASGRKLTNTAALNFLGADMMNDLYADGANQDFTKIAQNNDVIQKSLLNSGFKNQEKISQDPIGALMSMRGGILDFMMRDDKFKTFFGDREKFSYNDKGEMVKKNGDIVNSKDQNLVEMAAFKKFLAQSGISNNNVTGFATTMNAAYAQRAEHSVETAQGTKSREELLKDLNETWHSSIANLETSLTNLAITFEPLLNQLALVPRAIAKIIDGITEFSKQHNVITSFVVAIAGIKVALSGVSLAFKLLSGGKFSQFFTSLIKPASMAKDAIVATGESATVAGAVGRKGFLGFLSGALTAAGGVSGALGTILRVVGLAVSWVGWAALAAMVGGMLINWISDIDVGGKTVGQRMGDLMASVGETISGAINGARLAFWSFLQSVVGDTDYIKGKIESVKNDAQRSKAETNRIRNGNEDIPEDIQRWGETVAKVERLKKDQLVTTKQQVGGSAAVGDVPGAQGGLQNVVSTQKGVQFSDQTEKHVEVILNAMQKKGWTVNSDGEVVKFTGASKGDKSKDHKSDWQPDGWNATATDKRGPDAHLPSRVGDPAKIAGMKNQPMEMQNAFMTDYQNQLLRVNKDEFKIQELLGNPVSYQDQAKNEFSKKWLAGEFDDARDPSKRKFAKRGFDKKNPFTEDDIDFSAVGAGGVGPTQWIQAVADKLQKQAEQDAIKFSAGKFGEANSRLDDSLDTYKLGVSPDSTQASAAKRQYAKYEQKNPTVTQDNESYSDFKALSLAALAGEEYVSKVTEYRKSNYENALEFDADEIANTRRLTKVKFEEAQKQRDAYVNNMAERLKDLENQGLQETEVYKNLKSVFEETSKDMTEFNSRELKRRQMETESSYDKQMRMWRDYETTIEDTLSSFGQRGATDLWDIILGDQELDLRGYFSDAFAEIGGDFFKSAWAEVSKAFMGTGEGTSTFDFIRNLIQGTDANEEGALGQWLNSSREDGGLLNKLGGMLGSGDDDSFLSKFGTMLGNVFTKGRDAELQGDQATNANTQATNNLTQAMNNLALSQATSKGAQGFGQFGSGLFDDFLNNFGLEFGSKPTSNAPDLVDVPFDIPNLNQVSAPTPTTQSSVVDNPFGSVEALLSSALMARNDNKGSKFGGDQAVNANTRALERLNRSMGGFGGNNSVQKFANDYGLGGYQQPQVPNNPNDVISLPPGFTVPQLNPNSQGSDTADAGGMFNTIKNGFSSLFDSSGEGGVFSKIQGGFASLFSSNSGMMSKIGGSFGTIFSSLGSMLAGMFEKGSTGSRISGAAMGAMNGVANGGGWMGGIIGGITGALQSAKGNAFGTSGHIQAFAKGGEFTNSIVSSPTFFKFAKGGSFTNGVMGEAGPEAVMPLKRDGSGRLGVSLHGGADGGNTNNVSININVANDGSSSSKSTGDQNSEWKSMSNRVRMVVIEELVKQKRPGGALSR